MENGII